MPQRILSGIQPTGELHIGNYLGAVQNWVTLQQDYECLYAIVDLHAITIDRDPKELHNNSIAAVKDLLAAGIDPEKSAIFIQSHIPEHAELAWILNTLTPLSELERMTQFKDKSGIINVKDIEQQLADAYDDLKKEVATLKSSTLDDLIDKVARTLISLPRQTAKKISSIFNSSVNPIEQLMQTIDEYQNKLQASRKQGKINAGLFNYPILMAADILLYHAQVVPVGDDQLQHVELTRIIARKFNQKYGEYFKEPAAKITEAKRVMSLLEPHKKMSKSAGPAHYIALSDDADTIRNKVRKAVTDTGVAETDMAPGVKNLFDLLKYFGAETEHERLIKEYHSGTLKYVELKDAVAESIITELTPLQERRNEISDEQVRAVVKAGKEQASALARKTLTDVKQRVGFIL